MKYPVVPQAHCTLCLPVRTRSVLLPVPTPSSGLALHTPRPCPHASCLVSTIQAREGPTSPLSQVQTAEMIPISGHISTISPSPICSRKQGLEPQCVAANHQDMGVGRGCRALWQQGIRLGVLGTHPSHMHPAVRALDLLGIGDQHGCQNQRGNAHILAS